ncbi:MAG: hypothetical protein EBU88_02075 [Acidobacteria bacterium]|nr:hypothetical protein [Acidobacteriota bacterium]
MSNINQVFKYNRQRKNVIMGGTVILICITLLSCVSSFMIYREGFIDLPAAFQVTLSIIAVIVVEGAFVWLVYGFTRAFSSMLERAISFAGMAFLVCVMFINIVTHFMMVKSLTLHPLQETWLSWGAVSVFIAVLLIVLSITLSDPVIRLIRLELRYQGRQQEIILEAKTDGLQSEKLQAAMADRAEWEAGQLAARILGSPVQSGALSAAALTAPALTAHQVTGFSRAGLPTQGNFSTEGSYQALMEERDPKG